MSLFRLCRTARFFAAVLLFFFAASRAEPLHADQTGTIAALISQGGYALAGSNGELKEGLNIHNPFAPASTLKLVTALAALDILGPEHRFVTRLFQDQNHNLYIQGSGDPFLITEDIAIIAHRLHEAGIRQVADLILDDSTFALDTPLADGNDNTTNPYDAWNSALAVNFNSIAINIDPQRSISSDDPKVPLLPMMLAIGKNLPPGHHLVQVNAFAATGRLTNTLRYTGELFSALMAREQITIQGAIRGGKSPASANLIMTFRSEKTVRDILRQCLKYSNNFIANQLFLACGASRFGMPATWDKARTTLQIYNREKLGIPASELIMVEGSGLSRQNRITPGAMITALKKFSPYQELLPIKKGFPLKSGTMTGVYCYAGYIPQQLDAPFTILLNQPQNNRDEILDLLTSKPGKKSKPNAKRNSF